MIDPNLFFKMDDFVITVQFALDALFCTSKNQSALWAAPKGHFQQLHTGSDVTIPVLMVLQTQSIVFLKSLSERVGSESTSKVFDFWMITHIYTVSKSIEYYIIEIQSRTMSDPTFSDIGFKKWNGSTTLNIQHLAQKAFSDAIKWLIYHNNI